MTRKTPVRHNVRAHTRKGKPVRSFKRGKGTPQHSNRYRHLVPKPVTKSKGANNPSGTNQQKAERILKTEFDKMRKEGLSEYKAFVKLEDKMSSILREHEISEFDVDEEKIFLFKLGLSRKTKQKIIYNGLVDQGLSRAVALPASHALALATGLGVERFEKKMKELGLDE